MSTNKVSLVVQQLLLLFFFKDRIVRKEMTNDGTMRRNSSFPIVDKQQRKDMLSWMLLSGQNDNNENIPDGSFSSCSTNNTSLTNSSHHHHHYQLQYEWDTVNFEFAGIDDFTEDDNDCDGFEFAQHTDTITNDKEEIVASTQHTPIFSRELVSKRVRFIATHEEYEENVATSFTTTENAVLATVTDPDCYKESWPLRFPGHEALWWTDGEEEQMRHTVMMQCKALRVEHRDLLKSMFRCYDNISKGYSIARYVIPEYQMEILNWVSIELCCHDNSDKTASSSCVRGLESFVSKRITRERHRVIQSIIDCYRTSLNASTTNIQNPVINDINEHVRVQSLKLSYATRVFAHLLALSDQRDIASSS
jgi:hypothetical protein